jgi:glycosyltransferase involved in cell wall biosynthesis
MITLLHLITGLQTGGAERMVLHLATRTDRSRFRPVVVSLTEGGAMGELIEAAGVPVRTLGMRRGVPDPRGIFRLAGILREFRPAILQTWLYHADLLGLIMRRLGQAPHLVWGLQCSESIDTGMVLPVLARMSASPDAVVTVSEVGRRVHEAAGYRPRRWIHIPNAVDTNVLRPDAEARTRGRAMLGIADDALAVLLAARYHAMKDHANFLAAAALAAPLCPNAVFVLAGAGTGPGNPALDDAIASNGLGERVLRLGERRDLERLYPAFDLVTLSSAFGEGLPLVLAEAMACGIPCVATDCGDSAAIIGDAGIIVPPRDPRALAAAWREMLALAPEQRRELGKHARARVQQHYDLGAIVARYDDFYQEIARGSKS